MEEINVLLLFIVLLLLMLGEFLYGYSTGLKRATKDLEKIMEGMKGKGKEQ